MSKKTKKKLQNRPQPKPQQQPPAQTGDLDIVMSVRCTKGPLITMDECKACEHHDKMHCQLKTRDKKIEVVPYIQPMQFNRNLFQSATDMIREDSVQYYFKTDIMAAVNFITGYPNYSEVKKQYMCGAFTVRSEDPDYRIAPWDKMDIVLFLRENFVPANCDIMVDGRYYVITKPYEYKGDWQILLYLYNVHSLGGFADYTINGVGYRVLFQPVDKQPVDMVVARKDDKLIVGRIRQ